VTTRPSDAIPRVLLGSAGVVFVRDCDIFRAYGPEDTGFVKQQ
jgi:hypothetical protein